MKVPKGLLNHESTCLIRTLTPLTNQLCTHCSENDDVGGISKIAELLINSLIIIMNYYRHLNNNQYNAILHITDTPEA